MSKYEEVFRYDPDTGKVYYKVNRGTRIKAGDEVGFITNEGYRRVRFDGKLILVHRLAWFLYYEWWPGPLVDHINRIRDDNRIDNLRELEKRANCHNSDHYRGGVNFREDRQKWRAFITIDNKYQHIGLFSTEEAARKAYKIILDKLNE